MSIKPTITIKSNARDKTGKLIKGVNRAAEKTANAALKEIAERVVEDMKVYPDKLPNQKYVRTFTLKNSWKISGAKNRYQISNSARQRIGKKKPHWGKRYATYVVGNAKGKEQAQIHQGRWRVFYDVVKSYMEAFRFHFDDKIKSYLGAEGIKSASWHTKKRK